MGDLQREFGDLLNDLQRTVQHNASQLPAWARCLGPGRYARSRCSFAASTCPGSCEEVLMIREELNSFSN